MGFCKSINNINETSYNHIDIQNSIKCVTTLQNKDQMLAKREPLDVQLMFGFCMTNIINVNELMNSHIIIYTFRVHIW